MTSAFRKMPSRATRREVLRTAAAGGALAATSPFRFNLARAADAPIRIGFSMALTGALAGAGKPALIAMEIWRDDINAKGGLLGREVQFVYYDDQTQPANVPKIYTKLLNVDGVDLVVSGYGTNTIAPAMPIIMRKKMTFMTLFGLAANEQYNYDRYFQIMPAGPDPRVDWSRGFIELATRKDLGTIALVGADAEYPKNALAGARINAENAGLEIVYDESYPPSTTDFTPIIRAIQATSPDIVFVGSYPPDSAGMVRAANEIDLQTKLFGGGMVGLQFASLQTSLGPMLNGIVNYDFWVPEPTLDFPGIEEVLAKYQERAEGLARRLAIVVRHHRPPGSPLPTLLPQISRFSSLLFSLSINTQNHSSAYTNHI
jgi:branched-chain amino acid transport system substrate-binding protein